MKKFLFSLLLSFLLPLLVSAQASFRPSSLRHDETNTDGKKKKTVVDKKKATKSTVTDWEWQFFGGPDLSFGFPLGKIRDTLNNGVGFTIKGELFFKPQINIGIISGYKSYSYDQVIVGKGHFSYIPLKIAGTYYFAEDDFRPYVNLSLGAFFVKYKYNADFWTWVQNPQTNRLDTLHEIKNVNKGELKFGVTPSAGILYKIKDRIFTNMQFSYDLVLTEQKPSNFLGINLGLVYLFGF